MITHCSHLHFHLFSILQRCNVTQQPDQCLELFETSLLFFAKVGQLICVFLLHRRVKFSECIACRDILGWLALAGTDIEQECGGRRERTVKTPRTNKFNVRILWSTVSGRCNRPNIWHNAFLTLSTSPWSLKSLYKARQDALSISLERCLEYPLPS